MTVKLHRCSTHWIKGPHPCWQVQKALDETNTAYETVEHPVFPRGRRKAYIALTGQSKLPAIEFEDGSWYRDESERMVKRILAGELRAP